jgi:citrate lyase subunit beta/citryl-CoA lyase
VRINRELDLAVADIDAAIGPDVAALVLPKVKDAGHIQLLAELMTDRELRLGLPPGHTRIVALVETAAALAHINAIAAASLRMAGMAVGGEDLATDLDAAPTADSLYVAKMLGVHAARAAGILPIGVLASVANVEGDDAYRAMLARSRGLGFAAATCVHPGQVGLINAAFSPSAAQIEHARRLIDAYETAQAQGRGAILFDGVMVDQPVALRARRLLTRADEHRAGTSPS